MLLEVQNSVLIHCSQHKPEETVLVAVREILENASWMLWGSLGVLLPTLAEASPHEFLSAVETGLQELPCPFDELICQESPGPVSGANYLTGLLWALEALAWDETHLVRVCMILAKLAERDPGGNWLNRPSNSLNKILLPWLPRTTATVAKRKTAIENIMREAPGVAWNLLLSLLPGQTQSSMPTRKPTWRNTIPEDWTKDVDREEYRQLIDDVASLTLEMASDEVKRLEDLIGRLNSLPPDVLDKVMDQLFPVDSSEFPKDQRIEFWHKLTDFIRTQKREQAQFPESRAPLDDEHFAKVENIASRLAPQDPSHLHRWLFSHQSVFYIEEEGDWEKKREIMGERQQRAVREILDFGGMTAVIRFSESVEVAGFVGYSLGIVGTQEVDSQVLPCMLHTESQVLEHLVASYVNARHRKGGWKWVDGLVNSNWSISQKGQFLCYLPFGKETWSRASEWLADSEGEYWKRASSGFYMSDDDLNFAISKYARYGNSNAAIQCLYNLVNDGRPIDTVLAKQALLAIGKSSEILDSGQIAHIIRALQKYPNMDQDDMFEIEWFCLPLFRFKEGLMKTIAGRLASDPGFFHKAIGLLYPPKGSGSSRKVSESHKLLATSVFGLLHEWRIPPGTQPDGTFSPEAFSEWLTQARQLCEDSGHLSVGLIHVGQVLIHSPRDPGGFWIHHLIASALNDERSRELRDGFCTAISNSRGVHWVDPEGKPERELAVKYRGKAEEVEDEGYHRLAVALRLLAEGYDREAERVRRSFEGHEEE